MCHIDRVVNRPPGQLIHALEQNQVIDSQTAESLRGFFVMRNLAVHAPDAELSRQKAIDFAILAEGLLFLLRQKRAG